MSLCFYSACLVDDAETSEGEEKTNAELLLDLLMPIVKACNSDYGLKANELAIQILGGSGYTHEYPVEQCYRDNRLNPIHEGTNGIQALDLLGRKIWQNNGAGLKLLAANIMQDIDRSNNFEKSRNFATAISKALERCNQITQHLGGAMEKKGADLTLANAGCYLSMMGKLIYSWMWLRQSIVAEQALKNDLTVEENNFYQGKIQAAQYFIQWELPTMYHDAELLKALDDTCFNMQEDWF